MGMLLVFLLKMLDHIVMLPCCLLCPEVHTKLRMTEISHGRFSNFTECHTHGM